MKAKIAAGPVVAMVTLLLACQVTAGFAAKSKTKRVDRGSEIYLSNCESCHLTQGSNVIKPEKPVARSTKLASEEVFREFLSERHGVMPDFPEIVKNDEMLHDLYKHVKKLKNQSWEYHEPDGSPDEDEPESKSHS